MSIDQRDYYYTPKKFRRGASAVQQGHGSPRFSWRVALPFWLVVCGIGYVVFSGRTERRPALPLPASAPLLINQQMGPSVSPLTIRAPGSSLGKHYVIKLEEWNSSNVGALVFVRQGEIVSTKIAAGTYRIRVASGENWYGHEHLFGPGTVLETGQVALIFTGNQGQIIDLTQVMSGNLPMNRGRRF